jgi:hypothetical protein
VLLFGGVVDGFFFFFFFVFTLRLAGSNETSCSCALLSPTGTDMSDPGLLSNVIVAVFIVFFGFIRAALS